MNNRSGGNSSTGPAHWLPHPCRNPSWLACHLTVAVWALLLAPGSATAGELGVRMGAGFGDYTYSSQEVYWRPDMGFRWGDTSGWHLSGYTELNAGRITRRDAALTHAGAHGGALIMHPEVPVRFDLGTGPTYISRTSLAGRDYGGHWQFTSHLAVQLALGPRLGVGYRLQHISNAGLYAENDGIDIHALEIRSTF